MNIGKNLPFIIGLALLFTLVTSTVAVSAQPSYNFLGPTNCVSSGNTVTYNSNYGEDPNNIGDWDVAFKWNPQLMDFVDSYNWGSPDPYCERDTISEGWLDCEMAGFGGYGYLKLQVKNNVSTGSHLPVTFDGLYNGEHQAYYVSKTVNTIVCPVNPTPEFPSSVIPVIMIIGFLGAVYYIRRTREY